MFVDVFDCDTPYPQYQPSLTNYSPSFEEKVMQALDRIKISNQILYSSAQFLTKLEIQIDQLAFSFDREEDGELLSQSESNPEEQYLAWSFNVPIILSKQSIITLENEIVIEQPCITKKTNINYLTKTEIYREKSEWWDELIPSSPYLLLASIPSALESSILFYGMEGQIDEMIDLVETFQGP